jgi:uncharacterized protein
MKKFAIQTIFLMVVIMAGLYFTFQGDTGFITMPFTSGSATTSNPTSSANKLKIKDIVLNIDVADTTALRAKGLGGREEIPADYGMLFIFPEVKKHRFWMKGMKVNIDMLFIKDAKVVDLLRNIPAPTDNTKDENLPIYEPIVPVDMVLEVQAGFIDQHSIQVGDQVFLIQ